MDAGFSYFPATPVLPNASLQLTTGCHSDLPCPLVGSPYMVFYTSPQNSPRDVWIRLENKLFLQAGSVDTNQELDQTGDKPS
ncbi:hypothetical protein Hanom_Chr14g01336931 [Helianthus anomalus]